MCWERTDATAPAHPEPVEGLLGLPGRGEPVEPLDLLCKPKHSARCAAVSLSLACPRESNQREGHPVHRALRVRDRLRDSPTPHPCADGKRALPVRRLSGLSRRQSPRLRGPKSKADREQRGLSFYAQEICIRL